MSEDIRDRVIRTKALREMDSNAKVVDAFYDTKFTFSFDSKYSCGATTMGPKYKKKSKQVSVNKHTALDIKQSEDLTEWVNENKKEKGIDIAFSTYKNVSGDIYTGYDGYYKVKFADGETTWMTESGMIDGNHYFCPLLEFLESQRQLYVEPNSEQILVQFDGRKFELEAVDNPKIASQSQLEKLLQHYLSNDSLWVDAEFGNIREKQGGVVFPITLGSNTYDVFFEDPTDNRSPIWDLCSVFDYDDPWNLENEPLYYTIHPLGKNRSYSHQFIDIRPSKPKLDHKSVKNKIKRLIPLLPR